MPNNSKLTRNFLFGLKAALRRLVDCHGGVENAQYTVRVDKSNLCRAGDVNTDHYAAIDVIADLELDIGKPVVTEYLASALGYKLVPVTRERHTPKRLPERIMELLTELGEFSDELRMAQDPNGPGGAHFTPREYADCTEKCEDIKEAVHKAQKDMDALFIEQQRAAE
jgi:hypothetical protein